MINNRQARYIVNRDFHMVNGHALINHGRLMYDFGLTRQEAQHQQRERFSTEQNAAMAFALMYNQRSRDEGEEFAASINRHSDGRFSFSGVTSSLAPGNTQCVDSVNLPIFPNTVATIHTHWAWYHARCFTQKDLDLYLHMMVEDNRPLNHYVVNRQGTVRFVSPVSNNTAFSRPRTVFAI